MSPHPAATWVQMSIATRREVARKQRRRRTLRLLARGSSADQGTRVPSKGSARS